MFSCKITSTRDRLDSEEYAVTTNEEHTDITKNIISADSRFGRKLYDMVNSDIETFIWKGKEYGISDVIKYYSYNDMVARLSPEGKKIAEIIRVNKIKYLVHFTRIENLRSILENGVLSIEELMSKGLSYKNNDFGRYDGRKDCSCFSIEFPNDSLLRSFKRRQNNSRWIVLLIDVSVLISPDIEKHYCIHNAASKGIRQKIKYNQLRTPDEFQNMFSNHIEFSKSDGEYYVDRSVEQCYLPTSNQAEILIKGIVDKSYIKGLITGSRKDKETADGLLDELSLSDCIDSVLEPRYFEYRSNVKFRER